MGGDTRLGDNLLGRYLDRMGGGERVEGECEWYGEAWDGPDDYGPDGRRRDVAVLRDYRRIDAETCHNPVEPGKHYCSQRCYQRGIAKISRLKEENRDYHDGHRWQRRYDPLLADYLGWCQKTERCPRFREYLALCQVRTKQELEHSLVGTDWARGNRAQRRAAEQALDRELAEDADEDDYPW